MILQWMGGKFDLAPFIIKHMPQHNRYVEVFFGGGHVFWQKNLVKENIINDFNGNLINLYRVVADEIKYKLLIWRLENTIYSRELCDEYIKLYYDKNFVFLPKLERAFIYLYLNKTTFNGEFGCYIARESGTALYNVTPKVEAVHKKLRQGNTVIEHLHFRDVIEKFDGIDTLFYLDPPYWITTTQMGNHYYEQLMKREEHEELIDILSNTKGKWLLSYDDVPIIREVYSEFNIIETPKMHQSSSNTNVGGEGKGLYKSELLITNFDTNQSNNLFA